MKAIATLVAGAFQLAACVSAPPSGAPSPAQQLLDLKRAMESGAINEQDYDRRIWEILHKGSTPSAPKAS